MGEPWGGCLNEWVNEVWTPRTGGGSTVADVGEFGVLDAVLAQIEPARADIGPGDDAAVLPGSAGRTVVTTDSMVLDLDWRDEWSSPFDVGVKAIAQNLADITAMGARATGVVVALAAEEATRLEWLVELTQGMADELRRGGTGSLGGDLSGAAQGSVVVTVTALGDLPPGSRPLLRSGARVGEVVVVSDRLGCSHAGLLTLRGDVPPVAPGVADECVTWHRAPRPRYAGEEAQRAGVRCALDVSDGLTLDASRIARASGVRLDLSRAALEDMAAPLGEVVGERALECVLSGGEEHALLATVDPARVPTGWHVIGRVEPSADRGSISLDGEPLAPMGWAHYGDQ